MTALFDSPEQLTEFHDLSEKWATYDRGSQRLIDLAVQDPKAANDQSHA